MYRYTIIFELNPCSTEKNSYSERLQQHLEFTYIRMIKCRTILFCILCFVYRVYHDGKPILYQREKLSVIILLRENPYENKMKIIIIIHCTKRVFSLSIRLAGGEVDERAVRRFSSKSGKLDLFFIFLFFFFCVVNRPLRWNLFNAI